VITTFAQVEGGRDVEERADVVVIGTGAGGAAIAAELAEGGRDVVMIEEGGHYTAKDFAV
jgi:choline dehydrogenase-like flavoprotein